MVKEPIENGYYLFKLKNLLQKKKISINKLIRDTNTDFKVIQRLMNGTCTRIDIIVIARFCNYFHCSITDIIEYVNN